MTDKKPDLTRFKEAHERSFESALTEIRGGRKRSHWMWYIFPQIRGLGMSATSRYYAIRDLEEAAAFLDDAVLGSHLREICRALLALETDNATRVFGQPDDMKLRSSMTLFALASDDDPLFRQVLDKFFGGRRDENTLRILGQE